MLRWMWDTWIKLDYWELVSQNTIVLCVDDTSQLLISLCVFDLRIAGKAQ